jgi:hypothetical protein
LVVESNMALILRAFPVEDIRTRALDTGRTSVESWFTLAVNLTDRKLAE